MNPVLLLIVAAALGASPDLNGDGIVDGADMGLLLGAWSPKGITSQPATLRHESSGGGDAWPVPVGSPYGASPYGDGWRRYWLDYQTAIDVRLPIETEVPE